MGFTYKSSNVQAPDLYDPIDDNILLQGQKAIYDRTMAFAEEANKYKSAFFGQNAYGKDAEILKQKEAEYNAAISEVTKGGIESMEAQTAINAIINQASSDKDILGISQRTSAYEKELKNKQEAEAKGENFISPLLDQANTYYGSGKYYSDERFNGSGWNDPNVEKMKTEALKNVKVEKKQTLVNGVWVETEQYDPDALKTALSSVYSTPLVQKTMAYKFDNKYKDFDFAGQGVAQTENSINLARQQSQEAFRVLQTGKKGTPQYQKALEDYTESEAYINKYSPLLQNPTERGEMLKAQLRQDEINNEIELAMTSAQFKSESAIKESQFALNNQKYAQDREMKLLETKAQLFEGMSDIDQKKFLVNPNDPTINYSVAYQTIQTNKNKNARAAAPPVINPVTGEVVTGEAPIAKIKNQIGLLKAGTVSAQPTSSQTVKDVKQLINNASALIAQSLGISDQTEGDIIEDVKFDGGDVILDFNKIGAGNFKNLKGAKQDETWGDKIRVPASLVSEFIKINLINSGTYNASDFEDAPAQPFNNTPPKVGDKPNTNTVTPVTDSLANQGTPRGRTPR